MKRGGVIACIALGLSLFTHSVRALAHEFDSFPWLAKVESTYHAGTKDAQTFTGYGFVVSVDTRAEGVVEPVYVLVTAAHLTQGGFDAGEPMLKISAFDPVKRTFSESGIGRRMAHNRRDIEVVTIPRESMHLFKPLARLSADYTLRIRNEWIGKLTDSDEWIRPGLGSWIPRTTLFSKRYEGGAGVAKLRELLHGMGPGISNKLRNRIALGYELSEDEIHGYFSLPNGMSGVPLIISYDKGGPIVAGVYVASSRVFEESWFTDATKLVHAIRRAFYDLSADSPYGKVDGISWNVRDGLLYRSGVISGAAAVPLAFEEVSFTRNPTGNGSRSDGGNGTRSDGGDTQAPAFHIEDLKSGISFHPAGEAERQVLGFEVPWEGQRFVVPGDMTTVFWFAAKIYAHKLSYDSIQPIYEPSQLWEKSWEALKRSGLGRLEGDTLKLELKAEKMIPLSAYRADPVPVQVRKLESGIQIRILLEGDEIEFALDQNSNLARYVFPVSRSKLGKSHEVEFTGLLLTSPSSYFFSADGEDVATPRIQFRIKRGTEEFLVTSGK